MTRDTLILSLLLVIPLSIGPTLASAEETNAERKQAKKQQRQARQQQRAARKAPASVEIDWLQRWIARNAEQPMAHSMPVISDSGRYSGFIVTPDARHHYTGIVSLSWE